MEIMCCIVAGLAACFVAFWFFGALGTYEKLEVDFEKMRLPDWCAITFTIAVFWPLLSVMRFFRWIGRGE